MPATARTPPASGADRRKRSSKSAPGRPCTFSVRHRMGNAHEGTASDTTGMCSKIKSMHKALLRVHILFGFVWKHICLLWNTSASTAPVRHQIVSLGAGMRPRAFLPPATPPPAPASRLQRNRGRGSQSRPCPHPHPRPSAARCADVRPSG